MTLMSITGIMTGVYYTVLIMDRARVAQCTGPTSRMGKSIS